MHLARIAHTCTRKYNYTWIEDDGISVVVVVVVRPANYEYFLICDVLIFPELRFLRNMIHSSFVSRSFFKLNFDIAINCDKTRN